MHGDKEHVCKREQRDCLAPGASLFKAGTNLNAGLTELSTDRKCAHEKNSAQSSQVETGAEEKR